MRKILVIFIFLFSLILLTSCKKPTQEIVLTIKNAPEAYVKLNDDIDASQFMVNAKVSEKEELEMPLTDSRLNVTGLVNGKLDTSTIGEKIVTITYNTKTVIIKYFVANFLVRTYEELKEAVTSDGELIVLMDNIAINSTGTGISIAKETEKIIELNGHTISFMPNLAGTTELIKNEGTLTIQDRTDENKDGSGSGVITNKALNPDDEWSDEDPNHPFPFYANNTITNMGELIVESGLIENATEGGAAYAIDNNSTISNAIVTINGGKILASKNFAVRLYANSKTYINKINVSGGVIEGVRAIWLQLPGSAGDEKLAEINISNGLLRSVDSDFNLAIYSYTFGDSFGKTNITITGGTFEGDIALTGGQRKTPTEKITVTGGTFKGEYGIYSYGVMGPFITGGRFKANPTDYVNLDTHNVNTINGEYVVTSK